MFQNNIDILNEVTHEFINELICIKCKFYITHSSSVSFEEIQLIVIVN